MQRFACIADFVGGDVESIDYLLPDYRPDDLHLDSESLLLEEMETVCSNCKPQMASYVVQAACACTVCTVSQFIPPDLTYAGKWREKRECQKWVKNGTYS